MIVPKLIEIRAQAPTSLWLRYADGQIGTVDLTDIVGKGVFAPLKAPDTFESARLSLDGAVVWREDLELCPDALYLRLTGMSPEDAFPLLVPESAHA